MIVWGRDAFSHYDPFLFKKERKYFMKTRKKLLCMFAALMLSMFMFMNVGAAALDVADETTEAVVDETTEAAAEETTEAAEETTEAGVPHCRCRH